MLSALEAAYTWNEPAQLTVIKDLNSGAAVLLSNLGEVYVCIIYISIGYIINMINDVDMMIKKVSKRSEARQNRV